MMGITVPEPTFVFGDNQSVLANTTRPHSALKKKSSLIAYHFVREGVAKDEWQTAYLNTNPNRICWRSPLPIERSECALPRIFFTILSDRSGGLRTLVPNHPFNHCIFRLLAVECLDIFFVSFWIFGFSEWVMSDAKCEHIRLEGSVWWRHRLFEILATQLTYSTIRSPNNLIIFSLTLNTVVCAVDTH